MEEVKEQGTDNTKTKLKLSQWGKNPSYAVYCDTTKSGNVWYNIPLWALVFWDSHTHTSSHNPRAITKINCDSKYTCKYNNTITWPWTQLPLGTGCPCSVDGLWSGCHYAAEWGGTQAVSPLLPPLPCFPVPAAQASCRNTHISARKNYCTSKVNQEHLLA